MVLPGKTIHQQSFNTYRNNLNNDDFNDFLKLMERIYSELKVIKYNFYKFNLTDTTLQYWTNLVKENAFYFNKIKTFDEFIDVNFLQDFEDNDDFLIKRGERICKILADKLWLNI